MQTDKIKISMIRPNTGQIDGLPQNPRLLKDDRFRKLVKSIEDDPEMLDLRELIVVPKDGIYVVIAGNMRLRAMQELKMKEAPCKVLDADTAVEKLRAYTIKDNVPFGEHDWDQLANEWDAEQLAEWGLDLPHTFGDEPETAQEEEGAIPELPTIPITVKGDVWTLGKHRILCGDCRNFNDVEKLLNGSKINVAVTSPPYASQRKYDETSGFKPIPPDDYVEWYRDVASNIMANIASDGSYFCNIKPHAEELDTHLYVFDLVIAHVREWGWHFATEFCWERNGVPKQVTRRFKSQFEPVYQFAMGDWKMRPEAVMHHSENVPMPLGPGSGATTWSGKQGSGGVIDKKRRKNGIKGGEGDGRSGTNWSPVEAIGAGMAYPGNRLPTFISSHEALGHAAAFPVGLPDFFIKAYSDEGDTVYDPFMGSGSTLIAAEKNGRIGYGTEISPGYCDVIVKRWQDFTGQQAIHEASGKTFAELTEAQVSKV
jgi:DNA modification methylase